MQEAEEQLGYTSNTPVYHNNKFHDVVAIDNDEVLQSVIPPLNFC
jgi:hypothetical protein